jgi:hypothetical protein
MVAVRNSSVVRTRSPGARVITATEWAAFITGVRAGEFD